MRAIGKIYESNYLQLFMSIHMETDILQCSISG